MSKTAALSVRLEPALLARVKVAARNDARSLAQYVTLLLEREHPTTEGPIAISAEEFKRRFIEPVRRTDG